MSIHKPLICILSASIGNGHIQAARAVAEAVKAHPHGYRAQTLDFLSRDVISVDYWVRETYIKMIDIFPLFYELLYEQSQSGRSAGQIRSLLSHALRSRMRHLMRAVRPDALVFTHPFPMVAAAGLKGKGELDIPMVSVVTDFDVHGLWITDRMDAYCVPTPREAAVLMRRHIPAERIHVTGIPIMARFYDTDRPAREEGTVLIMGGGLGFGAVKDALRRLAHVREIRRFIVVTGHNVTLYDDIADMRTEIPVPVELYGYTDNIPALMARASLLITKPGALTCTEAMTMQLPLLLVDAIPGQEEANAEYLTRIGQARWITRDELVGAVTSFFSAPPDIPLAPVSPRSATRIAEILDGLLTAR